MSVCELLCCLFVVMVFVGEVLVVGFVVFVVKDFVDDLM